MGKTAIEWATDVWNPVTGCTKVSKGCKHCYAERFAKRLGYDFSQVELHPERMDIPLHWKKPRRVFVNSMSDLFHKKVTDYFIYDVFDVMARAGQHIFMVLTKRPERMADFCQRLSLITPGELKHLKENGVTLAPERPKTYQVVPLPNVWLGVSVEDQKTADERIPLLLRTPAAVRFVSCEPLLGPIDLGQAIPCGYYCDESVGHVDHAFWTPGIRSPIDWVICGGESGPGARPMHPTWARSIRDQCQKAGVPFFFKQWGEWAPAYELDHDPKLQAEILVDMILEHEINTTAGGSGWVYRVGKKAAGRLLDGREWNEYPLSTD